MQDAYVLIGGHSDGLNYPAHAAEDTIKMPVGIGKESYHRVTLSAEDTSITIYVHDSLTPAQALDLLVDHYRAWCVNRPGARR